MSLYRHPDPTIAAWLAEGPADLSSPARRAISATIRTTRQRPPAVLWVPGVQRAQLLAGGVLVALALTLAIAAGALRFLLPQPSETVPPTDTPAPTEAVQLPPSCPWAAISSAGRVRTSIGIPGTKLWVDYCPSASLAPHTGTGPGVVGFGAEPTCLLGEEPVEASRGVVVADVSGARRHGSLVEQPRIGTDAETFLRDLDVPLPYPPQDLVIDFAVNDLALVPVAGTTAWSARVAATVIPWASHLEIPIGPSGGCVEFGRPNRVWVFDVGGSIVLVQAWASDEAALAAWQPEATQFIAAFTLRADGPMAPTSTPGPSRGAAN